MLCLDSVQVGKLETQPKVHIHSLVLVLYNCRRCKPNVLVRAVQTKELARYGTDSTCFGCLNTQVFSDVHFTVAGNGQGITGCVEVDAHSLVGSHHGCKAGRLGSWSTGDLLEVLVTADHLKTDEGAGNVRYG